ncbi:IS110 family transposase [Phenylobacterium sp.]|jgi:transposase|uniref:IS110 family transposase n=1 Tax=Phenylobacterium sp. TaxID=1871053 RepID=UPI002E35E1D4|nr:IS110 family transposase [Phenylobacterium sp.]HEX3366785.1 IS110 family transposase [Phenylobacterium sp.]
MTPSCAAGVDVGRDFFDVGLAPSGRVFRTPNGAKGVEAVVTRLRREGVGRVVLESIGGYGARLVRSLAEAGFEVGVIDPKRIQALRIAEGKRAKTDRLDAALIARFALIMRDVARPVPSPKAFEIRALSTRRRQLVEMAAMEKVRLGQTLDEVVANSCRQIIAFLAEERAKVEALLQAELLTSQDGPQRSGLLQTIPGVGPAVSMTLMADLPELGTLDRKAIASLAGLAPHPNQSGTRTGQAHIGGGRPCVRAALYMAAVSAVRSDNGFKREYQALRRAGKPAKVALVAIARRIVVAANTMLKANRPWLKQT